MNTMIVVLLLIEILAFAWNVYRYLSFKRTYKKRCNAPYNTAKDVNIYIVIPCLREQDIILDTIKNFKENMLKNDNVKLVIVTTRKENSEKIMASI